MTDKWLQKELDLSQKHEELVMRREALLKGKETFYDTEEEKSMSFVSDYSKAMARNQALQKDIEMCLNDLRQERIVSPKFGTLKNNYWSMVKNIFPVWMEEQREYEQRHGLKATTFKTVQTSPPASGRQLSPGQRSPPGRRSPTGRRSPPGRRSPGNTLKSTQETLRPSSSKLIR